MSVCKECVPGDCSGYHPPKVTRPTPIARGYVIIADGSSRQETDDEFREYLRKAIDTDAYKDAVAEYDEMIAQFSKGTP